MKSKAVPSKAVRVWLALALVVAVLIGIQALEATSDRSPYDPDSTRPNGTKAFVLLMEQADAKVDRNSFPAGRTAVLMQDNLTQVETAAVQRWIEMGGTLIVGDPISTFQLGSFATDVIVAPERLQPRCQTEFLDGVRNISPASRANYQLFESDLEADAQCFPVEDDGYWLQQRRVGRGQIIELGGSQIFTNDRLDKQDNSVLLTNLVKPSATNTLTILETRNGTAPDGTGGDGAARTDSAGDLVPGGVRTAFLMVLWAAVLWILWQARRLGRPIDEAPLVRIPASQLVVASGDLLELAQRSRAAAATMSAETRRTLATRFGLRVDVETDVLIEAVCSRTGVDESRLREALRPDAVDGPEALVAFSQRLERLQQEVMHVR